MPVPEYILNSNVSSPVAPVKSKLRQESPPVVYKRLINFRATFRVDKRKGTGHSIRYSLFLLDDRMVFAKIGQTGFFDLVFIGYGPALGTLAGDLLLAVTSATFELLLRLFSSKTPSDKFISEQEKTSDYSKMSVEDILRWDKDNFELCYDDITLVKMERQGILSRTGVLKIECGRNEIFEIERDQDPECCMVNLMAVLPGQ